MRIQIRCAVAALALCPAATMAEPDVSGSLEVMVGSSSFANTDDIVSDRLKSSTGAADVRIDWDEWRLALDLNHIRNDVGSNDFDDYAPASATSLGVHMGKSIGQTYFGAFYGKNRFQGLGFQAPTRVPGYQTGTLYGLEFEQSTSFGSVFGQYGEAKMIGEGPVVGSPGNDTGFEGSFYRLGMHWEFTSVDLFASYEAGESTSIFEDDGDSGSYNRISVETEYPVAEHMIMVFGLEMTEFEANVEDSASETRLTVGLRVPLGEHRGRNNLKTPYMPGLAAAWAETLDEFL